MDIATVSNHPVRRYYIVHTFPDADAIGSSWLATRELFPCLFPNEVLEPRFVSFTHADPHVLANALAVFDIGYVFNPYCLRFDHHQLPNPRTICSTRMVWEYLTLGYDGQPPLCPDLAYLKPIIDLIEAGDACELDARGYGWSAKLGLHGLLVGFRIRHEAITLNDTANALVPKDEERLMLSVDNMTLQYGWSILDALAAGLENDYNVVTHLEDRRVYVSADGLVWGIQHAQRGTIAAAFDRGAHLVISAYTYPLPHSFMLEVSAAPEVTKLDVRDLIQQALHLADREGNILLRQELEGFYCERIYAGRGSPKAPNPNPPLVDAAELASVLDRLWQR